MSRTLNQVENTPSDQAMRVWVAAMMLEEGEKIEFALSSRDEAKRLQRWFYRERKRRKRQRLNEQMELMRSTSSNGAKPAAAQLDPDAADAVRGTVTYLIGSSLVIDKPAPLKYATITRKNGKTERVKLG